MSAINNDDKNNRSRSCNNNNNNNNNNKFPPEQAPCLKQIYEARKQLYDQNESDIEELQRRLEEAREKKSVLTEHMVVAKSNYEDASSRIVDLIEDDNFDSDTISNSNGNSNGNNRTNTNNDDDGRDKVKKLNKKTEQQQRSLSNENKHDDDNHLHHDDYRSSTEERALPVAKTSHPLLKKTPRNYGNYCSSSSLPEVIDLMDDDDDDGNQNESSSGGIPTRHQQSDGIQVAGSRCSSDSSSSNQGVKRTRSSVSKLSTTAATTTTMARKIQRKKPMDVPKERWLQSSLGRTRDELNSIDDMVQYMGSCQFSQQCVCSKFGKVHAIVLNDEWNDLVVTNDEKQYWYVGVGPGRKRQANLVVSDCAQQKGIPIFHAPKIRYKTKQLFYVGHYKVLKIEEYDPPIVINGMERQLLITLTYVEFDTALATIINNA